MATSPFGVTNPFAVAGKRPPAQKRKPTSQPESAATPTPVSPPPSSPAPGGLKLGPIEDFSVSNPQPPPPAASGVNPGVGAAVASAVSPPAAPAGKDALLNSRGSGGLTAVQPTSRGFAAFMRSKMAGANWLASTRDNKSGFVARDGAFKGQTKDQAAENIRRQYARLTPQQRTRWEQFDDATSDRTASPETQYAEKTAALQAAAAAPAPAPEPEEDPYVIAPEEDDATRERRKALKSRHAQAVADNEDEYDD